MLRQLQAELKANSDAEVIFALSKHIVDRIQMYELYGYPLMPECQLEFINADLLMDSANVPENVYTIFGTSKNTAKILANRKAEK